MIHQQHLRAAVTVNVPDDLAQMLALVLREAGAGLIHHDQARTPDCRAGDLNHAPFERIEVSARHIGLGAETDEIQSFRDQRPARLTVGRHIVEHGGDVIGGAQILDHLLVLEGAAYAERGAFVDGNALQILAVYLDRARRRTNEAGQDVNQRRLSGPVRPNQTGDRFRQARGQTVQPAHATEQHCQIVGFDHGPPRHCP